MVIRTYVTAGDSSQVCATFPLSLHMMAVLSFLRRRLTAVFILKLREIHLKGQWDWR